MDAIYGPSGAVVGWLFEGERLYSLRGEPLGWLLEDAVYSLRDGSHRGFYNDGLFRDHSGAVVAFTEGASGGPAKPARQARPARPARHAWPARPARSARRPRAAKTPSWSRAGFESYARG